jgi:sarcosine oxidase subunit alpha
VEKGFISMAHEADGIATPIDLGLAWAVKMDKPFFVGQAALRRLQAQESRPELVGLVPLDSGGPFEEGAALLADATPSDNASDNPTDFPSKPMSGARTGHDGKVIPDPWNHAEGFVTASVDSPGCGHAIALALLDGGRQRIGQTIRVTAQSPANRTGTKGAQAGSGLTTRRARVVAPLFHDPTGALMRG